MRERQKERLGRKDFLQTRKGTGRLFFPLFIFYFARIARALFRWRTWRACTPSTTPLSPACGEPHAMRRERVEMADARFPSGFRSQHVHVIELDWSSFQGHEAVAAQVRCCAFTALSVSSSHSLAQVAAQTVVTWPAALCAEFTAL